jgi:hypothetical protein
MSAKAAAAPAAAADVELHGNGMWKLHEMALIARVTNTMSIGYHAHGHT